MPELTNHKRITSEDSNITLIRAGAPIPGALAADFPCTEFPLVFRSYPLVIGTSLKQAGISQKGDSKVPDGSIHGTSIQTMSLVESQSQGVPSIPINQNQERVDEPISPASELAWALSKRGPQTRNFAMTSNSREVVP